MSRSELQRHFSFDERARVIRTNPKEYPMQKYKNSTDFPIEHKGQASRSKTKTIEVHCHPLAAALEERGLLNSPLGKHDLVSELHNAFTDRARQWEAEGHLRVDPSSSMLRQTIDPQISKVQSSLCSTPMNYSSKNFPGFREDCGRGGTVEESKQQIANLYPASNSLRRSLSPMVERDYFINMKPVRKGLCIRIVNSFLDGDQIAYTIWVYDVETGREWYAPIRYYCDFKDLRLATSRLCGAILQLPFPSKGWGVFQSKESSDSESAKGLKCAQLEQFIRGICGLLYRGPLHQELADVAFHLQSFIGCDTCFSGSDAKLNVHHQVAVNETSYVRGSGDGHDGVQSRVRLHLKRSLQLYVYRIFLLPIMESVVSQFILEAKKRAPSLGEMRAMDRKSTTALKDNALDNVQRIRDILDNVLNLVKTGCQSDMRLIVERPSFGALHEFVKDSENSYRDALIHDAIREQVEIEVYVPLRSVISRQLVNGWRHDDMEMQFKAMALRKKSQAYFKIPPHLESPSNWSSVSEILREGVGLSTLPYAKLRAIVAAAKEISRLFNEEHSQDNLSNDGDILPPSASQESKGIADMTYAKNVSLGADDFLPIFIFCVVRAELERPCALCVLLRTLCDREKKIGETGYFLASFEAAIEHIRELDLAAYHANETER
mmetsp:Transcript_15149/g.43960  ORF Transcript_15149/g.43960 Transcript_15149/m.43960 type:complete len:663 (-) Transcript_15149:397-2385(-)